MEAGGKGRQYDVTGTLRNMTTNMGSESNTLKTDLNNTVPGTITSNGFTSTLDWTSILQPKTQTGPNTETTAVSYDVADRRETSTSATGR